jgi:hypothetical protein
MDIGSEDLAHRQATRRLDLEAFRGVVHAHKMLTEIRKQRVKPDIKSHEML